MHCVWHSGQMLKLCRSMLSPFPLMCWKQQLFFFQWEKNGCKDHFWSAQTWQWPSNLFITLQFWLCWKNATQTVHLWQKKKKNIQAYRKRKKDNKKKKLENVWEDPKVFALMLLWNENLYDFGTIRTNENGDVAALCRHLKSPLLLFCFIIFLCATTVNDWCWLCKWARGKKHG